MITEQKKFSLLEMARVCSQLVEAEAYSREMSLYYLTLFNKHANCDPDSLLPNSPIAELYQKLSEFYTRQMLLLGLRIQQLQGIADTTMLAGLDY